MKAEILLPNMSGKIDFVGEPVKSIGYFSSKTNKRTSTIGIYTTNFVGKFYLQGSLKKEPKNDLDWFIIPLSKDTDYLIYDNYKDDMTVNRDNRFININGSYSWLRGIMDRSSYIDVQYSSNQPYDCHTNVMTAGSSIDADYTNGIYKPSPVNPLYDPEYSSSWNPNYKLAHERSAVKSKLGTIEKVILCY